MDFLWKRAYGHDIQGDPKKIRFEIHGNCVIIEGTMKAAISPKDYDANGDAIKHSVSTIIKLES